MNEQIKAWRNFAVFIAVMFMFRSAIADWNQVPSGSMLPTILIGDRIVVDKVAYDLRVPFTEHRLARWHDPQRGDIVTFTSPEDGKLLVKRVIGLPGERIELNNNRLIVDDLEADYDLYDGDDVPQQPLAGYQHDPQHELHNEHIGASNTVVRWRVAAKHAPQRWFGPVTVPPNHYLMLGDNRDRSQDSRFLGFVHRDRIWGRAKTVAFSLDYDNYFLPRRQRLWAPL